MVPRGRGRVVQGHSRGEEGVSQGGRGMVPAWYGTGMPEQAFAAS